MTAAGRWPTGSARALGGLLGAVGAEAWRPAAFGERFEAGGPVALALVDVGHRYVAHRGDVQPVETAERHAGVPGPAWLLPVAIARPDLAEVASDVLALVAAADIPRHAWPACVAYAELASHLIDGRQPDCSDIEAIGHRLGVPASGLRLQGDTAVDALSASLWALPRPEGIGPVIASLAAVSTPGVQAAVGRLTKSARLLGAKRWQHDRQAAEVREQIVMFNAEASARALPSSTA